MVLFKVAIIYNRPESLLLAIYISPELRLKCQCQFRNLRGEWLLKIPWD